MTHQQLALIGAAAAKNSGQYIRGDAAFYDGYADGSGVNGVLSQNWSIDPINKRLLNFPLSSGNIALPSVNYNYGPYTYVDRSFSIPNSAVAVSIDVYSTAAATLTPKILKRTGFGTYDVVLSENMSHGGTGWETYTFSSPYSVPATGSFHAACFMNSIMALAIPSVLRSYLQSNPAVGTGYSFTEDTASCTGLRVNYGVANLDLVTRGQIPDAAPKWSRLLLEVAGVVTLNTNLTAELSADAAAHFAAAPLSFAGTTTRGVGETMNLYESAQVNVSGNTGVAGVCARVRTANGVSIKLARLALDWGQ